MARLTKDELRLWNSRPRAWALVVTANLALPYHLEGRADDALQLTRAVFREQRRLRGPRHPEALLAASNLAGVLLSRVVYDAVHFVPSEPGARARSRAAL